MYLQLLGQSAIERLKSLLTTTTMLVMMLVMMMKVMMMMNAIMTFVIMSMIDMLPMTEVKLRDSEHFEFISLTRLSNCKLYCIVVGQGYGHTVSAMIKP